MENEGNYYVSAPWENRVPTIYHTGDTLKPYLPAYLSKIRKHYGLSPASTSCLTELSPLDLHRQWRSGSHRDHIWSSIIMGIAPSVVCVSVFTGVQRKMDCTGLIIHWDDSTDKATVITSAKIIRLPQMVVRDDYYIVVRLSNGKILLAEEDYVDFYHNIITLKVSSDVQLTPVDLSSSHLEELDGSEVCGLSREFYTCSLLDNRGIIYKYYPYFGCELLGSSTCSGPQAGEGGPLVTKMGDVCGINFFDGYDNVHPLPTSVIRSCLDKWNSHGIVVQPWFGFTVVDIAGLPCNVLETIATGCCDVTTTSTVVIKQVYEGSPGEESRVCSGDLLVGLNGIPISSVSQYNRALSTISDHLSASSTQGTLESNRTQVFVHGKLHEDKAVLAKNLTVDDRRFCCCWPGNECEWYRKEPLFGSQTDYPYVMGVNHNVPSWFTNV